MKMLVCLGKGGMGCLGGLVCVCLFLLVYEILMLHKVFVFLIKN